MIVLRRTEATAAHIHLGDPTVLEGKTLGARGEGGRSCFHVRECEEFPKQFDGIANGPIQVGRLPPTLRVTGKVAWMVYAGPYRDLGEKGLGVFWQEPSLRRTVRLAICTSALRKPMNPKEGRARSRSCGLLRNKARVASSYARAVVIPIGT
jgi:hypothetical protein